MNEQVKSQKSIKLNSIIYAMKLLMAIVSPMITFPYISRTLLVSEVGSVNFCSSIINYFVLLSALGISSYAVRTGVKYREDREKFSQYVSEIFSINLCSTIASYLLFFCMFLYSAKWKEYTSVMLIISIMIPMTTLGMEWVFTIYEEYVYITVRSFVVQVIAIIYLFTMVRNEGDVIEYAIYTVLVNVGSNIFNFIRVRKYCNIKIHFSKQLITHIKPILVLFASAVACQIYLNSDVTMLGYLKTDMEVGIYSAAVKIYNLIKTALSVFITVSAPRLAYYKGKGDLQGYSTLLKKVISVLVLFLIPATVGVLLLSEEIIVLISGNAYISAAITLRILALAISFSVIGSCMASGCLLLYGKEVQILYATVVGAVLNLIFNFFSIPKWGENGAAITTVLAEMVVLTLHLINVYKVNKNINVIKHITQCIIAIIPMCVVCCIVSKQLELPVMSIICTAILGAIIYFAVLIFEKNQLVCEMIREVWLKLKSKK